MLNNIFFLLFSFWFPIFEAGCNEIIQSNEKQLVLFLLLFSDNLTGLSHITFYI